MVLNNTYERLRARFSSFLSRYIHAHPPARHRHARIGLAWTVVPIEQPTGGIQQTIAMDLMSILVTEVKGC